MKVPLELVLPVNNAVVHSSRVSLDHSTAILSLDPHLSCAVYSIP